MVAPPGYAVTQKPSSTEKRRLNLLPSVHVRERLERLSELTDSDLTSVISSALEVYETLLLREEDLLKGAILILPEAGTVRRALAKQRELERECACPTPV